MSPKIENLNQKTTSVERGFSKISAHLAMTIGLTVLGILYGHGKTDNSPDNQPFVNPKTNPIEMTETLLASSSLTNIKEIMPKAEQTVPTKYDTMSVETFDKLPFTDRFLYADQQFQSLELSGVYEKHYGNPDNREYSVGITPDFENIPDWAIFNTLMHKIQLAYLSDDKKAAQKMLSGVFFSDTKYHSEYLDNMQTAITQEEPGIIPIDFVVISDSITNEGKIPVNGKETHILYKDILVLDRSNGQRYEIRVINLPITDEGDNIFNTWLITSVKTSDPIGDSINKMLLLFGKK